MIARPAQYILRVDDLCPTMSHARWERLARMIVRHGLRPILAIVPANDDPDLMVDFHDPKFWEEMRAMEAAGATIALHGYQHRCRSRGKNLLPMHSLSEFAGVDEETQRAWIRAGLGILRVHGLEPKVWVAPRHGFDGATMRALQWEGMKIVSDGLARVVKVREGMIWIPQQLWRPAEKRRGLWTILIHPNNATEELLEELEDFVRGHAGEFTSVDRVVEELDLVQMEASERMYERAQLARLMGRRVRRWWLSKLLRGEIQ